MYYINYIGDDRTPCVNKCRILEALGDRYWIEDLNIKEENHILGIDEVYYNKEEAQVVLNKIIDRKNKEKLYHDNKITENNHIDYKNKLTKAINNANNDFLMVGCDFMDGLLKHIVALEKDIKLEKPMFSVDFKANIDKQRKNAPNRANFIATVTELKEWKMMLDMYERMKKTNGLKL